MRKSIYPILAYILIDPWIGISIRYLTNHFDAYTIISFRMYAGFVVLSLLVISYKRKEFLQILKSKSLLLTIFLISLIGCLLQYFWVSSLKAISATEVSLFGLLSIPISAFFCSVLFEDEQNLLRNTKFIKGAVISIAASFLVILAKGISSISFESGLFVLFTYLVLQVLFIITNKSFIKESDPIVLSAILAFLQGTVFYVLALKYGSPQDIAIVPKSFVVILLLSGAIGIMIGMGLWGSLVKKHGATFTLLLGLSVPVIAAIVEFLFFNQVFTVLQISLSAIVLYGSYLSITSLYQN